VSVRLVVGGPAGDPRVTVEDLRRLADAVDRASESGAPAILLAGDGPDFCRGRRPGTGLDHRADLDERAASVAAFRRFAASVRGARCPVVVAARGAVTGMGWGIAATADVVLASTTARFALPELDHGFAPTTVMSQVLASGMRQGLAYAVLSGRSLDARAALRAGAVAAVVPDEELDPAAADLLARIAAAPPDAVAATVALTREAADAPAQVPVADRLFADLLAGRRA
jgi:enoyl-CoA hydratase